MSRLLTPRDEISPVDGMLTSFPGATAPRVSHDPKKPFQNERPSRVAALIRALGLARVDASSWKIDYVQGRKARYCLAAVLLFLCLYSVLIIGNYNVRLANAHGDNSAVFYAHLIGDSNSFDGDVAAIYGKYWVWTTIAFSLPALLYKHLGFDPRYLDVVFYFLQIVLMGLAFFASTWLASRSWIASVASMSAGLILWPWGWNLAAYPALMHMPFYTSLAEALAVLAATAFLAKKTDIAFVLGVSAALCHPVIAGYVLVMLLVFLAMGWRDLCWRAKSVVQVVIFAAFCAMPFLVRHSVTEELLNQQEIWEAVSKHMHSLPFNNWPPVFKTLTLDTIGFGFISCCCWKRLTVLGPREKHFIAAVGAGTLLLCISQLVGIEFRISHLALAMGLRAISLLVLLIWPFVFSTFNAELKKGAFAPAATILALVLVWLQMGGGIPVFQTIALGWALYAEENRGTAAQKLVTIGILVVPFALTRADLGHWAYIGGELISNLDYALTLLVSMLVARGLGTSSKGPTGSLNRAGRAGLACMLAAVALGMAYRFGEVSRRPPATDLYDAEMWANRNTARGARFMTLENWRTVALRPTLSLYPLLTQEIYTPFRKIRDYNQVVFEMCGIADTWRQLSIFDINGSCDKAYAGFSAVKFEKFARKLGGRYLVRRQGEPELDLPIAYQNGSFRIYDFGEPSGSVGGPG